MTWRPAGGGEKHLQQEGLVGHFIKAPSSRRDEASVALLGTTSGVIEEPCPDPVSVLSAIDLADHNPQATRATP